MNVDSGGQHRLQQGCSALKKALVLVVSVFLSFTALSAQAQSAQAPEEDPGGFKVFWRDGLRMETNDGRFQFRLGGRIQYDWVFWGDDAEVAESVGGPILNGTEFRRT